MVCLVQALVERRDDNRAEMLVDGDAHPLSFNGGSSVVAASRSVKPKARVRFPVPPQNNVLVV